MIVGSKGGAWARSLFPAPDTYWLRITHSEPVWLFHLI